MKFEISITINCTYNRTLIISSVEYYSKINYLKKKFSYRLKLHSVTLRYNNIILYELIISFLL